MDVVRAKIGMLPPAFSNVPVEQVGSATDASKAVAYRKLVKLGMGAEFWDTRTEKAALKFLLATERTGGPARPGVVTETVVQVEIPV